MPLRYVALTELLLVILAVVEIVDAVIVSVPVPSRPPVFPPPDINLTSKSLGAPLLWKSINGVLTVFVLPNSIPELTALAVILPCV